MNDHTGPANEIVEMVSEHVHEWERSDASSVVHANIVKTLEQVYGEKLHCNACGGELQRSTERHVVHCVMCREKAVKEAEAKLAIAMAGLEGMSKGFHEAYAKAFGKTIGIQQSQSQSQSQIQSQQQEDLLGYSILE